MPFDDSHSRALSKLGLSRKKKELRLQEQDRPEVLERRREFRERLSAVDWKRLVFVDEYGVNTAMTRTRGRAAAERRVYATTSSRWEPITLISGVRLCERHRDVRV